MTLSFALLAKRAGRGRRPRIQSGARSATVGSRWDRAGSPHPLWKTTPDPAPSEAPQEPRCIKLGPGPVAVSTITPLDPAPSEAAQEPRCVVGHFGSRQNVTLSFALLAKRAGRGRRPRIQSGARSATVGSRWDRGFHPAVVVVSRFDNQCRKTGLDVSTSRRHSDVAPRTQRVVFFRNRFALRQPVSESRNRRQNRNRCLDVKDLTGLQGHAFSC